MLDTISLKTLIKNTILKAGPLIENDPVLTSFDY